eukprot:768712-Hanusia_phi.AAC.6
MFVLFKTNHLHHNVPIDSNVADVLLARFHDLSVRIEAEMIYQRYQRVDETEDIELSAQNEEKVPLNTAYKSLDIESLEARAFEDITEALDLHESFKNSAMNLSMFNLKYLTPLRTS